MVSWCLVVSWCLKLVVSCVLSLWCLGVLSLWCLGVLVSSYLPCDIFLVVDMTSFLPLYTVVNGYLTPCYPYLSCQEGLFTPVLKMISIGDIYRVPTPLMLDVIGLTYSLFFGIREVAWLLQCGHSDTHNSVNNT